MASLRMFYVRYVIGVLTLLCGALHPTASSEKRHTTGLLVIVLLNVQGI